MLNITIAPGGLYWKPTSRPHQRIFLGQDVYVREAGDTHLLRVNKILRSSTTSTIFRVTNNSNIHSLEFWVCIPHHWLTIGTALLCVGRRIALLAGKRLFGCVPRRMAALTLPSVGQLGNFQSFRHVILSFPNSARLTAFQPLSSHPSPRTSARLAPSFK